MNSKDKTAAASTEGDYNLRLFRPIALYLEEFRPVGTLAEIAGLAGLSEKDLRQGGRWVSHAAMERLLAESRLRLGSEEEFSKAAAWKMLEGYGPLLLLIRATSPGVLYQRVTQESKAITRVSSFQVLTLGPRHIELIHRTSKPESRLLCLVRQAQAAVLPTAWGLPPAVVKEGACVCQGDEVCSYDLTWHETPRLLPPALGLALGAAAAFVTACFGQTQLPAWVLLPCFGWLAGAYYERGRVYRTYLQEIADAEQAVRELSEEEALARQERWRAEGQLQAEGRKSSQALAASAQRFAAILEKNEDVVVLRDAQGKLIWASPSMQNTLGYTFEELRDVETAHFVHPEDAPGVLQTLRALKPGGSVRDMALRLRHKDGRWLCFEGSLTNLLEDPAVRAVVSNFRDVTERRQLEEQLRQAQKMEGIGQLAGGVAHDFNNILSVILGYSSLLLEDLKPSDPAFGNLKEIHQASQRATQLTRQLLAFSRQQMLEPKIISLNDVVREMDPMLRRLIGEDVEFLTRMAPDLGLVKVDPGQMGQVLMNMVVNARDAMPDGGKLTIETSNVDLDQAYTKDHLDVKPGPHVMLAVSDTGIGMDAVTQTRIFEPFFTTKPQGKGTGLGLSTAFGIVRQSGGHMWLYSEPGKGTSFKVYFPLSHGDKEEVASPPPAVLTQGTETILLVEDEAQVRALARRVLQKQGYAVLEARHGAEALQVSSAHQGPIHLLLTDVIMPQMSGRQLAEQLLPQRPEMKVLYMSGYTDNSIVHHGILDQGIAFLQKPFSPQALAQMVRTVLGPG